MTNRRCGPLAAWIAAWRRGVVGPDDVIDAVTGGDAPHLVTGLPEHVGHVPLSDAIAVWRRRGGAIRVVLPVPGDVRGLPGPSGFRGAALDAGETVCGAGIALVPEYVDYAPSSAPPTVLWHA